MRSRKAQISLHVKSDQGIRFPITESMGTVKYISDCSRVLGIRCSHVVKREWVHFKVGSPFNLFIYLFIYLFFFLAPCLPYCTFNPFEKGSTRTLKEKNLFPFILKGSNSFLLDMVDPFCKRAKYAGKQIGGTKNLFLVKLRKIHPV